MAVFAPLLAPHSPIDQTLRDKLLPPAWMMGGKDKYFLGTDAFGRDILSRLIYGARVSLLVALLALTAGGGVGLAIGIVAGYVGGAVDSILMRLVDAAFTFPAILFALLLAVTMGQGLGTLVIAISLLLWASFARVIRGEVLALRQRDFVALAKVRGCSSLRIMATHILPNVLNTFMVLVTLNIGVVIIAEATLSLPRRRHPAADPDLGPDDLRGPRPHRRGLVGGPDPGHRHHAAGAVGQPVRRLAARPPRSPAAPAMSDTVLEVRDLHTHFFLRRGVVKAVDGVSFSLKRGEVLGLVGESGCGKSLTALSLMRLLPKGGARTIKGEVLLGGENILERTPAEMREIRGRRISMVLQDPQTSLNPVFSIGDQLREAIERRRKGASLSEIMKEAVAALRRVEIAAPEQRIGQYPHQMSGGMKQRVVGAIAISGEPEVLIADEPTTALDVTIQLQYLKLLEAPAGRERHGDPVHHPRFRRGRPHVRSRGGDVCRPHRRMRAGEADLRGAVASLHPRADRLGAQDDRRGRPAHHHRGPAAVADGPAGRLPLRLALRPCRAALPRRLSRQRTRGRGAHGGLLEGDGVVNPSSSLSWVHAGCTLVSGVL